VQTQDFKIRYTSISRLFILPKASTPHTLVVIGLDPPIRKGQTYYSYLLCQFNNDDDVSKELNISDELLAQKNEKVC
jgi:structure-specific recognition protein 1